MRDRLHRALRRLDDEQGFTLIELMVVCVNLGVLLALSMAAFSGTMGRARDTSAKHGAVRGIETGRIVYSDHASYTYATTGALGSAEPNITFVASSTPSSGPGSISSDNSDATGNTITMAVWSQGGTCFFIKDSVSTGVSYAKTVGSSQANCTAANASGVTWVTKW
jgi:prepilin-type N-terminal cleavage/methylation domain-containing protein